MQSRRHRVSFGNTVLHKAVRYHGTPTMRALGSYFGIEAKVVAGAIRRPDGG